MKKIIIRILASVFVFCNLGFSGVHAGFVSDTIGDVYYESEVPSDQMLIELASEGVLYQDENVKVEKSTFESGELTIIQTRITKHISTTIKSDSSINSYTLVLHNEMYLQNTFAVGVMEAYIGYDTVVFGNIPHFKVKSFGHRLISYESLFGSPVSLTSVTKQGGYGTIDGNDYEFRIETSTPFVTTSAFFTRQSRSTYFAYFIQNMVYSGAGVDTTIKWRNKNGTYSYFLVNTCFIGNDG